MGLKCGIILFLLTITVNGKAQIGLSSWASNIKIESKVAAVNALAVANAKEEQKQIVTHNRHLPLYFSPSTVYDEHFGGFCKLELHLERKTKVPLRFRLGSLDYVNALEGK